ncbi:MAG: CoA ester lyase [Rhodococcus sp. (in: high G+C Gram-positive bacteria)]
MRSDFEIDRPQDTVSGFPVELARSWWLVSGAGIAGADLGEGGPDAVVVDLEDGVAPAHKDTARVAAAKALGDRALWVRINDIRSPYWQDDVRAIGHLPTLAGIMVAKTESPADIDDVARVLPETVPLVAFIESAAALESARTIADHPRVNRLAFGSGDFRMDVGAGPGADALAYARSRLVVVSRAADLPGPIDGPTVVDDAAVVEQQTAYALSLGMRGRLCLYRPHAEPINRTFSPTAGDLEQARAVIAQLGPDGSGATKGSDLPRLLHAHRVLDLAKQYRMR